MRKIGYKRFKIGIVGEKVRLISSLCRLAKLKWRLQGGNNKKKSAAVLLCCNSPFCN